MPEVSLLSHLWKNWLHVPELHGDLLTGCAGFAHKHNPDTQLEQNGGLNFILTLQL